MEFLWKENHGNGILGQYNLCSDESNSEKIKGKQRKEGDMLLEKLSSTPQENYQLIPLKISISITLIVDQLVYIADQS